ncbi:nucleoside deaminase [Photorhabdus akhurstii]
MNFVKRTIDLAMKNVEQGGRPFATVIVRDGDIIAESPNLVAQTCDPTAHAEILAVREACKKLGTEHLTDCDIYILSSPCPMCLGSLYYCSPKQVIYITTREDYAPFYKDEQVLRAGYVLRRVREAHRGTPLAHDPKEGRKRYQGVPALAKAEQEVTLWLLVGHPEFEIDMAIRPS